MLSHFTGLLRSWRAGQRFCQRPRILKMADFEKRSSRYKQPYSRSDLSNFWEHSIMDSRVDVKLSCQNSCLLQSYLNISYVITFSPFKKSPVNLPNYWVIRLLSHDGMDSDEWWNGFMFSCQVLGEKIPVFYLAKYFSQELNLCKATGRQAILLSSSVDAFSLSSQAMQFVC